MLRLLYFFALVCLLMGASVRPAAAQIDLPVDVPGDVADEAAEALKLKMKIKGGDVYMLIEGAAQDAGVDPATVADATTRLEYEVGAGIALMMKITVETICPGQQFNLSVEAGNTSGELLGGGTPAGRVELTDGMAPADFVRDLLPVSLQQSIDLAYEGRALMSQGQGIDYHTILYSLTEQ